MFEPMFAAKACDCSGSFVVQVDGDEIVCDPKALHDGG
jgi:hypothetical protein